MEVVIVTGLSGAGKTKVKDYFEDKGYYSIDNIPPSLIKNFIDLSEGGNKKVEKACFVFDLRGGNFFSDCEEVLSDLKENKSIALRIVYINAQKSILIRRYNEARRTHPLSATYNISLEKAIDKEIELLKPFKDLADTVIDTSKIKASELNGVLDKHFSKKGKRLEFTVNLMSFGYKKGLPIEADWIVDARFIPNPYYVDELRYMTGNDDEVKKYVLKHSISKKFIESLSSSVLKLIPSYKKEGKYSLTLAVGCTGGQHRSVVIANALYDIFSKEGLITTLEHRDL